MEFIAFIGEDKENWGQITALLHRGEWEKIVLVKSKQSENFPVPANASLIELDMQKPMTELKNSMIEKLKPKLSGDFEVALSIASGNGKEHMALISALLQIPVGIKLAVYTKDGVQYIT